MVLRIHDMGVGLRWVLIVLMLKNRDYVRLGAALFERLRERASPRMVELMAEQQNSAAPHANFEQSGHDCLDAHNMEADGGEGPTSGFR